MGDFNFPNIDWQLISSNGLDGAEFVKCIQGGCLSQYVDRPTRGNAILDLVLNNEPGQVTDLSVGEHLGDSDHRTLAFNIIMEKDRIREDRKIFNWGRANYEAIRLELAGVNWDDVFAGKCTKDMWSMFRDLLQNVRDKFVPVRKIKNGRAKEPWVTSEVENLVRWKKAAYMRIRKQGSDGSIEEYRKELKKKLRRARRGHEKALVSRVKENPKVFFNYVKNKRMTGLKIGPIRDKDRKMCLEAVEVSEILNEYFSSVFTKERELEDSEDNMSVVDVLEHVGIKGEEVLELLKYIRMDKSPGPDGILPRLLHEVREEIADSLARIFMSSLSTGMVLEDWREANVVPLFKKGSRDSPGNYRPVSLTSVVGKLLEKILKDRIYGHLENHGLIRDSQHGFVKGRSCLNKPDRVL
ncbi:ubiquitin-conjugating enzyme E2 G2 isoform X1 [Mobula hypostoma]|uniref:ubiquitin-conjugating enzyme E2 G2 isoform X1 n=1 Tax=Mobula hypostoma TaxID=723540 RepID=UPI002FC2FCF1